MASAKKKKRPAVAATKPADNQQQQPVASGNSYVLPAFLLTLASALLYGHSLWNPLVFDDLPFFVDYDLWQHGASFFHLDLRWFSYASFGWTYKLFGLDWFWYRLGNLALHALTSVLLFVFFSRLLDLTAQPQGAGIQPRWLVFFAALVFALHPVAVYGVAYLVQRSIVMATLFGVAALLCYLEGLIRDKAKWFVVSALFYFLAVFSKEHSIMIPGVAAALTLLLHKPSFALVKKVWLPFALYFAIATLIILRSKGVLGTAYEPHAAEMLAKASEHQEAIGIENAYPLSVITQGYLFFKYLLLWIVPYTGWMSIDIREPFATHFLSWPELPGFILFLAYPVLAMKLLLQGGRKGLIGFGLLFPWILYLTELASVRIQEPFVLYRSYLWMSGLPIVLCGFMGTTTKKFIPVLLVACCLVLASLAWERLDTFSSSLTLWSDVISKYKNDHMFHTERGYGSRGLAYIHLGQTQLAQEDFRKAATLNPEDPHAALNVGAAYFLMKNFPVALQNYNRAIELKPDFVMALVARSALFLQIGRYADAISDCQHALLLESDYPDAYLNCGLAHAYLGKMQEAVRYLGDTLRIDPKNAIAYYNRGLALLQMSRYAEAFNDFDQAVQLNPEDPLYYLNRGTANVKLGKLQQALNDYDKALSLNDGAHGLDSDYNKALLYRGAALNMLNRKSEAMESFRKSCDAGNSEACNQLH